LLTKNSVSNFNFTTKTYIFFYFTNKSYSHFVRTKDFAYIKDGKQET